MESCETKKHQSSWQHSSLWSVLFICGVSLFSSFGSLDKAEAGYADHYRRYGMFTVQRSFYDDARLASGDDVVIQDTFDAELAFRVYRIFALTLNASIGTGSDSSDRTDYGVGVRVGLPGFFFFGATLDDAVRRRMKHPVNTSLYFVNTLSNWKGTTGSLAAKTSAYRFGFTTDIFLFNPRAYLRLELGIYNTRGNAFLSQTVGLGFEF